MKQGAYRPPHARGSATPNVFKREDEGGSPFRATNGPSTNGNTVPGGSSSLSALLTQPRKRTVPGAAPPGADQNAQGDSSRRKKKPDGAAPANGHGSSSAGPPATPVKNAAADVNTMANLSPADKKRRALIKKLGAIEQLKGSISRLRSILFSNHAASQKNVTAVKS